MDARLARERIWLTSCEAFILVANKGKERNDALKDRERIMESIKRIERVRAAMFKRLILD